MTIVVHRDSRSEAFLTLLLEELAELSLPADVSFRPKEW
jgi:hypothetical protein